MLFQSFSVSLLIATIVSSQWTSEQQDESGLRHLFDKREVCRGTSCSACFGAGSTVCEGNSCYNPTLGQQCCKGGKYCVGADTSCCSNGAGITGGLLGGSTSSQTKVATTTRSATLTYTSTGTGTSTAATPSSSSWKCMSYDTDEQCCQRGGSDSHWCSGGIGQTQTKCYRPARGDQCCSNGKTCLGTNCCAYWGAVSTSPVPRNTTSTQKTYTATYTNTYYATVSGTDTETTTSRGLFSLSVPTVSALASSTSTSRALTSIASTSTAPLAVTAASNAGANDGLYGGFAGAVVGVLGIIGML